MFFVKYKSNKDAKIYFNKFFKQFLFQSTYQKLSQAGLLQCNEDIEVLMYQAKCRKTNVIYEAKIKTDYDINTYIGLCSNVKKK